MVTPEGSRGSGERPLDNRPFFAVHYSSVMQDPFNTSVLNDLLAKAKAGDSTARNDLIRRCSARLELLTRKMLKSYPAVRRWEETGDVFQNAAVRLVRALNAVTPTNTREFFGLAAEQIRRELIDLARHY